jgi:hypothetical protein
VAQGVIDKTFSLPGPANYQIKDLAVVPGQPNAVLATYGLSASTNITSLFVNGVAAPNNIASAGPNMLAIDPTGQQMYGFKSDSFPSSFWIESISSTGLQTQYNSQLSSILKDPNVGRIEVAGGQLFTDRGAIIDLSTQLQVASFLGAGNFTIDTQLHRLFSVQDSLDGVTIRAYDLATFALIGTEFISAAILGDTIGATGVGAKSFSLTRWGDHGLAFRDSQSHVVIIQSALVPEPSTIVLAACGALMAAGLFRTASSRAGRAD